MNCVCVKPQSNLVTLCRTFLSFIVLRLKCSRKNTTRITNYNFNLSLACVIYLIYLLFIFRFTKLAMHYMNYINYLYGVGVASLSPSLSSALLGFCLFVLFVIVSLSCCQIVHVNITNNFAHTHTSVQPPKDTYLHTLSYQGTIYPYTIYISTQSQNLVLFYGFH